MTEPAPTTTREDPMTSTAEHDIVDQIAIAVHDALCERCHHTGTGFNIHGADINKIRRALTERYPNGLAEAWTPRQGELVTGTARNPLDADPVGQYVETTGTTALIDTTEQNRAAARAARSGLIASTAYVDAHTLRPVESAAHATRVLPSQSQKDLYQELLAQIWLYVDWRRITRRLTTEQRELWADAIEAVSEADHPGEGATAERWWRDHANPEAYQPPRRAFPSARCGAVPPAACARCTREALEGKTPVCGCVAYGPKIH